MYLVVPNPGRKETENPNLGITRPSSHPPDLIPLTLESQVGRGPEQKGRHTGADRGKEHTKGFQNAGCCLLPSWSESTEQHQGPPENFPWRLEPGDRQERRESESSTRHPTFYQDKHVRIFGRKVQKKYR